MKLLNTLSFYVIEHIIEDALNKQRINTSHNLVLQELLKAFMNQISSLKILYYNGLATIQNIPFVSFPEGKRLFNR